MNPDLGLQVLGEIMGWEDAQAEAEFQWILHMSKHKYDSYRDFAAGARFVENLVTWLQQFSPDHRGIAYEFIRNKLVYFGALEFQRLVENFYPRHVLPFLRELTAAKTGVPSYLVQAHDDHVAILRRIKRTTLFMALSDGARLDGLRHENVGNLSNEQFVVATEIDRQKWDRLLEDLREELQDEQAKFSTIFLIDDFMGTGTSFLRPKESNGEWTGKLVRFAKNAAWVEMVDADWKLCVHHHVASHAAIAAVGQRETEWREQSQLLPSVRFSFGLKLPEHLCLTHQPDANKELLALTERYYDPSVETKHTRVGGTQSVRLGYGNCALPLVLEHNTPNNSLPILWAETEGSIQEGQIQAHAMRPLFRRRQRHT